MSRGWLKIGELAKKLGVPSTTIRYYTDIGLLPVIAETRGGYRLYDEQDAAARMSMIRQISSDRPTLREAKDMIERRELSPVA
jgi:DNA-binding transcriptional MerR regulator